MSAKDSKHKFVVIQDWATAKPEESIQVSLFIRALQMLYDEDYTQTLSYFQIAGIHGYPGNVAWDKSSPPNHERDKQHDIYCTHNLLTFPTWHRSYMALFEQTIYQFMDRVIRELHFGSEAEKNDWVKESTQWRLPYWDWAVKTEVPDLFRPPTVKICMPLGPDGLQPEPEIVPNPLYRYELRVEDKVSSVYNVAKMGDLPAPFTIDDVISGGVTFPWSQCSGTSRWGIKSSEPDESQSLGINNFVSVGKAIKEHGYYDLNPDAKALDDHKDSQDANDLAHLDVPTREIQKHPVSDLVYRLLSNVKDWASFSSTITATNSKTEDWEQWISLEYIHNNLHGFIGGSSGLEDGIGHMMNVSVAAFDPIFYMHHCNIDRLFAIWQVLHENSWFEDMHKSPATDPLTPFHRNEKDYFNSNYARTWLNLGYQYDLLQREYQEKDNKYLERIKGYVTKMYHNTGKVLRNDEGKLFKGRNPPDDEMYDDYMINVIYDRYGYQNGAPYTIHFLFEEPSPQETTTASGTGSSKNHRHVGRVFTFSSPIASDDAHTGRLPRCGNCAQQLEDGVLSRASIPLTIPLYKDASNQKINDISSLVPGEVEKYLDQKLTWVTKSTNGATIPWSELKRTKVFVFRGKAKHYHDPGILCVYQDYKPLSRVTHDKDAGASHEEYAT